MAIQIGTVIRAYAGFARPPKEKRFIVVGIKDDKVQVAVVFINSEVNGLLNYNILLQSQHLAFESSGRNYLTHDSYIDCSEIHPVSIATLEASIVSKPEIVIGQVEKTDMDRIMRALKHSDSIKGKYKKKFGFFDYKFEDD